MFLVFLCLTGILPWTFGVCLYVCRLKERIKMELRVLQYFLTVVREGGITKGARALNITQPTLSRQLAQLEEECGVRLFVRRSGKLTLTEEGSLLCRRAAEISALVSKTELEFVRQEKLVTGSIAIGSSGIEATRTLTLIMRSFRDYHPNVSFEFLFGDAEAAREQLDTGTLDLALLLEPVDKDKYEYIRMNEKEKWAALLPADSPLASRGCISPEELINETLILPPRPRLREDIASWFGVPVSELKVSVTSNMSVNAALLVDSGLGYALTIEGSLPYLDSSRVVKRALSPELSAASVIAWKKDVPSTRVVRRFIEFVRNYLKEKDAESYKQSPIAKTCIDTESRR